MQHSGGSNALTLPKIWCSVSAAANQRSVAAGPALPQRSAPPACLLAGALPPLARQTGTHCPLAQPCLLARPAPSTHLLSPPAAQITSKDQPLQASTNWPNQANGKTSWERITGNIYEYFPALNPCW
ncbi:hypothetical protein PCANC_21010 [Puccinia coronata f. sp. avenae]|uniref:Uncharacterized protein n=1 Tax=Puccinia coronata f. sp. avenae TaxID=200324 RepID=A0A2N5U245_9BASI|nr:hypothetical protein PCANC_21010 [Puccinia coronata f. sp. avenae]